MEIPLEKSTVNTPLPPSVIANGDKNFISGVQSNGLRIRNRSNG